MSGLVISVTVVSSAVALAGVSSGGVATVSNVGSSSGGTPKFGERIPVAGRVTTGDPVRVSVRFRASGTESWKRLHTTRANGRGQYRTTIRAKSNGALQIVPRRGDASRTKPIRIKARTRLRVSTHNVNLGNRVRLGGLARPGGHRRIKMIVKGPDGRQIRGSSNSNGKFGSAWTPQQAGTYTIRAFVGNNRKAAGSGSARRKVTVFRPAGASWYGPGGTTACGQTLTAGTIGVAHKTLPCGTRLTLRYGNRQVRVRVIDRGPYVAGREFDLTYATKEKLGFGDVGTVYSSR